MTLWSLWSEEWNTNFNDKQFYKKSQIIEIVFVNFKSFFSNRKKRMKQLQKKIKTGKISVNEDDPFELFVSSTNIRYCYYSETHKILGSTYGMCILQVYL